MVLTLNEAYKLHMSRGDYAKAGVVKAFSDGSPLLTALQFMPIDGAALTWTEEAVLPTAAWRNVNGSYTAGEATSLPRSEPLKIAGGTCQVDRAIVKTLGDIQRTHQIAQKVKAISQMVGYGLLHGDPSVAGQSAQPNGLVNRFPISGTRDVANGAAALKMTKLDEAIDETSGATAIIANRATIRNIGSYLRSTGGAIVYTTDSFGRRVASYGDLPFIVSDPVEVASAYRGLPFTEAASTCSLFVVSIGLDALTGIQNKGGMEIEDIGVTDTGILRGHLVEWLIGLADQGPRCVTRLSGVTNAVATAS
jgi:hypothetical protein